MTKIMLVEDDKSLREIYGVRLQAEGYDIKSAGDGEEALAMAIREKPDLILADVMMPKISGFDMLDILRSTPETRDIKVIMMTALSSEDQRARGETLGANRYLVKSQVGIEDVVRTIHEVLADSTTPDTTVQPAPAPVAPAAPSMPIAPPVIPAPIMAPQPMAAPMTQPMVAPAIPPTPTPEPVMAPPAPILPPQPAPVAAPTDMSSMISQELGQTTTPQPPIAQ